MGTFQAAEAEHASQTTIIRGQAIETATQSRTQMIERDQRQNPPPNYENGEITTLRIPKKNRTAVQNKRLVCRILDQAIPGQYRLQTEYGVLTNTYPAGEIDSTSGTLEFSVKVSDLEKKISLNFAAKQERSKSRHQQTPGSASQDLPTLGFSVGETATSFEDQDEGSVSGTIVVQASRGRLDLLVDVDSDGLLPCDPVTSMNSTIL